MPYLPPPFASSIKIHVCNTHPTCFPPGVSREVLRVLQELPLYAFPNLTYHETGDCPRSPSHVSLWVMNVSFPKRRVVWERQRDGSCFVHLLLFSFVWEPVIISYFFMGGVPWGRPWSMVLSNENCIPHPPGDSRPGNKRLEFCRGLASTSWKSWWTKHLLLMADPLLDYGHHPLMPALFANMAISQIYYLGNQTLP